MPGYPWMVNEPVDSSHTEAKLKTMRSLGVPYTDDDIAGAVATLKGKTQMDALIAYLQVLGTSIKSKR
jgi:cytochrome c oxidase cbb3-type subunit 2